MKQILNIAYFEIVHIFRDRLLFLIVFCVPLLYTALFGAIYFSGTLQHIPLGIVDLDQSAESRTAASFFANNPNFQVVPEATTYEELEAGMKNGTLRAGVVIPEGYAQQLSQHQLTEIATVLDGSNLLISYNTRKYFQQVLNALTTDHTAAYLAGLGMTKQEITNVMDTVSFSTQIWYNPTLSYVSFIFMGFVIMILHQIGLLGVGLTVQREKERNSWIQFVSTSVPAWKIFIGKGLPYFITNFFNYGLLLWLAAYFVNVKIGGSVALILVMGLLFDVIIVSLGFLISLFAVNSLQVTRYLMLLSVPLFALSGFTWPGSHMPAVLNWAGHLLPYTWMANGFRLAILKNLGFTDLSVTLLVLTITAALTSSLALNFTKRI